MAHGGTVFATGASPRPGIVTIRLAQDESDLAAMLDLGRVLHAESRYRAYPVDETRLLAAGRMGLAKGNPGLILAERDGQLIGMAIVVAGEHFFSAAKAATVQLIYVHPKARGGQTARRAPPLGRRGQGRRPPYQQHHRHRRRPHRPVFAQDGVQADGWELCAGGGCDEA